MLDIKLKNSINKENSGKENRKISFLTAAAITALAAVGMLLLYPRFGEKVNRQPQGGFLSDAFVEQLYKGNYVLYKDMRDKAEETGFGYADLYLEVEMTDAEELSEQMAGEVSERLVETENLDEYTEYVKADINNLLEKWQDDFLYGISENLDYCVIDGRTKKSIKNTGRNIEALLQSGDTKEKRELPYVYYVRISYDGAGNIENVAVKDRNSDELLKRVQTVMRSMYFESCLNYIHPARTARTDTVYRPDENGQSASAVYRTKTPENVTFIYALTRQQVAAMEEAGLGTEMNVDYAYYSSGIMEAYEIILVILLLLGLLLMHGKSYCLHKLRAVKIPLEYTIIFAIVLIAAGGEGTADLARITNSGYFGGMIAGRLPSLPAAVIQAAVTAFNFVLLFLLFAAWMYCVNSWGGVTVLGFREYMKQRSLLVRLLSGCSRRFKAKYARFKEEMLHADLSGETDKTIFKAVAVNFVILAVMCSMWVFGWAALILYSLILFGILRKYVSRIQDQYRKLLDATGAIAEGNLNTTVEEDLGVFESYKQQLFKIQEGFRRAVDEEVKSQRMKAELITNVSHDLKTPLTAITTYIDLLKEENTTEEQRREYIGVLEKKSLRLKSLIEDLFEVSKATSGNVTIRPVDVDILNLMRQVYLEYQEQVEEAGLFFRFRTPEEKIILKLDSEKACRIFENLFTNIIKYAMPASRVYVDAERTEKAEGGIRITMKNMSAAELKIDPEELTERFVRGDSARNTEGNGLGLAIAKSFTELQGGAMKVEVDGDLFKVTLEW